MEGEFGFNGFLDIYFLCIGYMWYDVQKGSGSSICSISYQTFAVSPAINDLVDLCPNIWCNISKETFLLGATFFDLSFSFVFKINVLFLSALWGRVNTFFFLSPNYNVQNPLWNKQVCPILVNIIIENNLSCRSSAKSTLWNIAMKGSPLLSYIRILTRPFCFSGT